MLMPETLPLMSDKHVPHCDHADHERSVLWTTLPGRPDNFTGPDFLHRLVRAAARNTALPAGNISVLHISVFSDGNAELNVQVLNADVQPRSYWAVVNDAQSVSLQVSIVTSVLQIHFLLLTGGIGVAPVLTMVMALICFGQVFVRRITGTTSAAHARKQQQ
jgi:hypothetical protein